MANFISSITLHFRDLFSQGMGQARTSIMELQSSLNAINPAGLASLSSLVIDIPAPEIGRPIIPIPDNPSIDIPVPEIGQPDIPTPDNPSINIPVPEIGQPIIPIPDNPPITIPTPDIPQSTIPAPDVSLFTQGLNEIQVGLDNIAENNALTTLATQLSVMNTAMLPIQQSLNSILEQPSKLAGSFESSMKNIQVLTGNTNEDMAVLNRQLLEIGKTAVAGPQGVVDAMNDIVGGVDNAESHLGILNGAILLAEAGQADLGVAANGLVSIMNAYRLASGDAASATANAATVSDVLTQTVGQGVGSMEAFIGAFSQVSGLSASVGVGFDEVGSALAFITTQGPSAAEAATQLKAAETALLNPNKTLSEALQSIGIASGSAMLAEYGLVESLNIVRQSVGGSQDAMAKALGSTEALNGATALLGSGYIDFATTFGTALESGVTAEAAAIQNQSYESKLARMEAATQVLQLQIGDNINAIKGNFVELGTGFLTNVVSPIMASPLGGVFQNIAAVVGVTGQGLLSFGGTALTTATQFTTLAANIKNAGGYAKIFHGTMTIMQAPFKAVGGMVRGFITNLLGIGAASASATIGTTAMGVASGASAAPIGVATIATGCLGVALNSVLWPILAVVATVGLIAGGAYLLVKNWDSVSVFFVNLWNKITGVFSSAFNWIRNRLAGMSDWVLGAVAIFIPFIGIPALIIKHWDSVSTFFVSLWSEIIGAFSAGLDWIKNILNTAPTWISAFFQSLWASITSAFAPIIEWFGQVWSTAASFFTGLWNGITTVVSGVATWFLTTWNNVVIGFTGLWNQVPLFFTNLWNGITGMVSGVATWFAGIWGTVTAPFAEAFIWIGTLFASVWEGIKGVVVQFVAWISPVVDAILAPFQAMGTIIGGIIDTVGSWFGKATDAGNEAVRNMRTDLAEDTAARPINTATETSTWAASSIPVAPESRVSIAAPDTKAAGVAMPDLGASIQAVPIPELGSAITIPNLANTGTAIEVPGLANTGMAIEVPTQPIVPQTITATAAASGNSLAMEHIEAAQRKGIATSDSSYTASSAFENAGYTPPITTLDLPQATMAATSIPFLESLPAMTPAPQVDIPDIDHEARVTFAEAMPYQKEALAPPWNQPTEPREEKAAVRHYHIKNITLQADDCFKLFEILRQFEMAVEEPEEEVV